MDKTGERIVIELFEQNIRTENRQSSKGNQLKWENEGVWYKADCNGYEGLAEYVVSHLLKYSSLDAAEYVLYDLEEIKYKKQKYNGVRSLDFVEGDWQIITLERLFKNKYGKSLYQEVWHIDGVKDRQEFLIGQVRNMTGLADFDKYLNKIMTIDAFFLNEDRHMHNMAVMMNSKKEFDYCRIFDNGACLLSDTTMEYPIDEDIYGLIKDCKAKTFSRDFDEQLDESEKIAGQNLKFSFTKREVQEIIEQCNIYDKVILNRVETILYSQMKQYQYLFV